MGGHHATEKQVVVTGIGVVSPIGMTVDDFWNSLRTGKSGIRECRLLPALPVPRRWAGEVDDFNPANYAKSRDQKKAIRVMCRDIQMGFAAASLALDDAGITGSAAVEPDRLGVEFGANLMLSPPEDLAEATFACINESTNKFEYSRWGDVGLAKMFPLWLLKYLPNMPACHIGIAADARGPNNSITMDEASANLVIGEALRVLARGHADVMITGSTGCRIHPTRAIHAVMWDELASVGDSAVEACRPFDRSRTGQVIGEGAGVMILEEAGHAERRGAKTYGRILGAGSSCVNRRDGSSDPRRAMVLAMRTALADAGISPADIGHVNAHGLASRESDATEAQAIHDVFGDYGSQVPVTALKSFMGNSAAGCGSLELLGSLIALQHGVVPFTLNCHTPDPACRLNIVTKAPLTTTNRTFLKLNVTRFGQASAVVAAGM